MVNTLHREAFGVLRLTSASSFYLRECAKQKKDGFARPFFV